MTFVYIQWSVTVQCTDSPPCIPSGLYWKLVGFSAVGWIVQWLVSLPATPQTRVQYQQVLKTFVFYYVINKF